MGAYLKALLRLLESRSWVSPGMWKRIIENADQETLVYLQSEGVGSIKYFTREDWMDKETKEELLKLLTRRLSDFKETSILEHFFDIIF
jgi:hypothetical protein